MEQPFTHSGTRDPAPSPREQENAALARQAAAAGIVLLKNRGVLPLNPGAPVALFGAGAGRTVKGGTGSGDVNNRASVSIWQGLKEAGVPLTSEDWLADCEARYTRAREDWRAQVLAAAKQVDNPFDAYAARPFALPEGRTIRPQDLRGAKAAFYVISRIAGEGKDRRLEPGDYYLSDAERADLQTLDESGLPVVLLLSAPQGELPRERRRLAGFAKKQLAAFHPEQNAWVVDAGLYGVWVGNSSDALRLCALLEVDAAVTLERTPIRSARRSTPLGNWAPPPVHRTGKPTSGARKWSTTCRCTSLCRWPRRPRRPPHRCWPKGIWTAWCRFCTATSRRGPARWARRGSGCPVPPARPPKRWRPAARSPA